MQRKVLLAVGTLIVLVVIGKVFVLPVIDMEMMKAPLPIAQRPGYRSLNPASCIN